MEWISNPEIWISLLTLTLLEIVLGIDNIIFISILSGKLPAAQQRKARQWGLGLALITRILLLCGLAWVVKLDKPFWEPMVFSFKLAVSGKDIILILGGLFLLGKSTFEIHEKLEGVDGEKTQKMTPTFIVQAVEAIDHLLRILGAKGASGDGLRLATCEQGRAMRAGEEVGFTDNRTDLRGRAAVDALAILEDRAANDFSFQLLHQLVGGHLVLRRRISERGLGRGTGFVQRV